MRKLFVSIERNRHMIHIGNITGEGPSDACFQYSPDYLKGTSTVPLSISLPLQEEPFSAAQTAAFFEGLLPEGFSRRSVAQWMHVDEGDYLSILHGLGRECLGAICITTEDEEVPQASYEPLSAQQVRELAAEGAAKSAEIVTKSHLSLTGASGKAGLYYDAEYNQWFLPQGTAPSTHIVKQSHVRLESIVTNEHLSLLTAACCGITTPDSFIINNGKGEDHELLFATARFDRVFSGDPETICDLPRPSRLHQEDFAQAMGVPAARKYEPAGGQYMKDMFDILRKYSANPIADQLKLWDVIVFNYLIGNTDAHVKNFSLLYGENLKTLRLAPAYDIISTTVYEQSTREMAFRIGGVSSLDDIDAGSFRDAAVEIGLGERMAMQRFDDMCNGFQGALRAASRELIAAGFPKSEQIARRILETGGARKVL